MLEKLLRNQKDEESPAVVAQTVRLLVPSAGGPVGRLWIRVPGLPECIRHAVDLDWLQGLGENCEEPAKGEENKLFLIKGGETLVFLIGEFILK